MHVLPRVRELEDRFADVLSVVGVHAGKFSTERRTDRIADACARLGVHHAVVNDRRFRIWREYGVTAWPTVALIDPKGYLIGVQAGEFSVEALAAVIQRVVLAAEKDGALVRGPDPAATAPAPPASAGLRFPTRAIVDGRTLWVSDTGNGRVLECALEQREAVATVVTEYGGFEEPRGLARLGGHTYVADRRGQAILRLRPGGRIERVAGTGRLADSLPSGSDTAVDLRSPWGLLGSRATLAFTMAGSHQLWELDPTAGTLRLLAGRGGEDLADGPGPASLLAQPTGLAAPAPGGGDALGDGFYFADCETSAVRGFSAGEVYTVAGTGLFDFGDRDGIGDEALLQHCEDVAVTARGIAVADTYNDRLRLVDPATRRVSGWPGAAGVSGAFREPAGVWAWGDDLVVSDTGNHRIAFVRTDGTIEGVEFA